MKFGTRDDRGAVVKGNHDLRCKWLCRKPSPTCCHHCWCMEGPAPLIFYVD